MNFKDYLKEAKKLSTPKLVKQEIVVEPVKARNAFSIGELFRFKVKVNNTVFGYIIKEENGWSIKYNAKKLVTPLGLDKSYGWSSIAGGVKLKDAIANMIQYITDGIIDSDTIDEFKFFVKDDTKTLIKKYKDFMLKNQSKSYVKLKI